ncbi:MAG TPA: TIGR00725 family protein [Acidimicrobiales bacterium]|nr:TIGR00725 family protein [Acidimicrobiales bacterium]
MALQVAVVGASNAVEELDATAEAVGAALASAGATIVCGGLGGVMEAACRGAKAAGGLTVGFLPGTDPSEANAWVDVVVPTGMGEARNILVVRCAEVVVALGGEYGTLSEIALALRAGTPVVGLGTWSLVRGDGQPDTGMVRAADAATAVSTALRLAAAARA